LIAFPGALTTWVKPVAGVTAWARPIEGMTTATPLGALGMLKHWEFGPIMRIGELPISYWDCAIGRVGGCLGETSALALLIGGLFLIAVRIIRWQTPVAFIGTVLVISGITHTLAPQTYAPPLFHLLVGGLFLGAFFMATDMVTSPMTGRGSFIFGLGCGVITCVIRLWGSYPEGVSFSILIMNALTPLIDRFTALRPFGARHNKEAAA
jgi:electron transport complex protein RnfD